MAIGPTIENLRKKRADEAALLEMLYSLPTPTGGFDVNTPAERRQLAERGLRGGEPYSDGRMDYGRRRPNQVTIDVMPQQPAEFYAREVSRDILGPRATNDLFGYPQGTGTMVGDMLAGGGLLGLVGAKAPLTAWDAGTAAAQGKYGDAALKSAFSLLEGAGLGELATGARGLRAVANEFPEAAQRVGQRVRGFLADESGSLPLPMSGSERSVQGIEDVLRAKYPDVKLSVSGSPERGYTLNKIDVPKEKRESGIGTAVMNDLIGLADQQGAVVKLSPSKDFGGSVPRLKDFYSRFGFVQNKGKNADYSISESMYRVPSSGLTAPQTAPAQTRGFLADESGSVPLPFKADDPAQARGAQIIDMLTSGRAGEITEQMLDMGDPVLNANLDQYLFRNYDLPMDEASRMGRANSSKFNTGETLFRGDQNPDMQQFNTGQFARDGIGVTASTNADVASTYMTGETPALYPIYARAINPISVDAGGRNWSSISADAETNYGRLNDVLSPDSYLDEENLFSLLNGNAVDWGDGSSTIMAMANTDNLSRAAQAAGFDQVRFENIVDRGGAGKYVTAAANLPSTTVMTSNPANIRSRFARFDPRLSHLRNLSAGVAPFGLLALQPNEEQY